MKKKVVDLEMAEATEKACATPKKKKGSSKKGSLRKGK